jgi:hypothetical protein
MHDKAVPGQGEILWDSRLKNGQERIATRHAAVADIPGKSPGEQGEEHDDQGSPGIDKEEETGAPSGVVH